MQRGRSQELDDKLRRFSARAESGSPASIVRAERRASAQDTFRSGWSRSIQVTPPCKSAQAVRRSNSLPGSRESRGQGFREQTLGGGFLQLPSSQDSATSLADRITSRSLSAGQRTSSSTSTSGGRWRFARELPGKELSHEGWLAKRSSGKISGRWQQRYFRLEGCYLRYMQTPSSTAKKTFNLQKAQNLSVAEEPRELVLDFGYRSWRLRAADAGEARRWLVLLEAGRLTAGNAEEGDASQSDVDDCASVCSFPSGSSTTAESLHSMEPATPKFGTRDRADKAEKVQVNWRPAPAIADILEVNTQELDRQFDSWLPFTNEDASVQTATPSTSFVCDGLSRALHGLWLQLCEVCATAGADEKLRLEASGKRPAAAAERAVTALLRGHSEAPAARESLENFLGEYLLRIMRRMEFWIERHDPSADELATVAKWWLFDAEPALLPFCHRAESFAGEKLEHSEQAAIAVEKLLLREWESRSCEEASALCTYLFEGHYAEEAGRVDLSQLLRSLQNSADSWQTWRGHSAACNRAASVLVAMLNAALRSQHAASRMLVSEAAKLKGTGRRRTFPKMIQMGRQALHDFQKVGACSDGKHNKISEEVLAAAAQDALHLETFCSRASDSAEGWGPARELCREVLLAFEGAFQTEVSSLTRALTTVHYHYHRQLLKVESFGTLLRNGATTAGILTSATAAWSKFLQGFEHPIREQVGTSIVELLASAWVQNFVRAPPLLSVWGTRLFVSFASDEESLASLAPESKEFEKFQQIVGTVRDFLQVNAQARWQELGKAESVLQKLLADEQGRALTHALWQTATH